MKWLKRLLGITELEKRQSQLDQCAARIEEVTVLLLERLKLRLDKDPKTALPVLVPNRKKYTRRKKTIAVPSATLPAVPSATNITPVRRPRKKKAQAEATPPAAQTTAPTQPENEDYLS